MKKTFKWKKGEFSNKPEFSERYLPIPPDIKTSYEYFKIFFPDELVELVVYHTNLYSVQSSGRSINVTNEDIRDFIAIEIMMGIVDMPLYLDYWSEKFRYPKIADIMSLKRYHR